MHNALRTLTYQCGHKINYEQEHFAHREELYRAAESFSCPHCCKVSASALALNTQVYVNMQRLSDEMSALVLEVAHPCMPLEKLLGFTGYVRRAASLDELHPGGIAADDEKKAVWRKEFWFAAVTNPFHVISLIELVKDEAHWLQEYLPQQNAVHFLDFPNEDY